jgi:hypothetical protein
LWHFLSTDPKRTLIILEEEELVKCKSYFKWNYSWTSLNFPQMANKKMFI